MTIIRVSHEFHGMSDYWGGNGRRWDTGAGCLFAFYGPDTTLRDCVDQWVDDYWQGGDFDAGGDAFKDISGDDIREAILTDLLNKRGRADYDSGALCEFAAECEDDRVCNECGEPIGQLHDEHCEHIAEFSDDEASGGITVIEDECDDDDCFESPIWVILVEIVDDDD